MVRGKFVVRPVGRKKAREMCKDHSHAKSLPNTAKYNMVGYLDGKPVGLASWGYGIKPAETPKHLFGKAGKVKDYVELSRYFVYDWTPDNMASQFLAATHRQLKKHTDLKWLYTYAAGFQGLIGTIYQASNYDYIGKQVADSLRWIPDKGLVHEMSLWHRYNTHKLEKLEKVFQGVKTWCGYNFRYIYWLCRNKEKKRLMKYAKFEIKNENPTKDDLKIWTIDPNGNKQMISSKKAKEVPIIKLKSNRGK